MKRSRFVGSVVGREHMDEKKSVCGQCGRQGTHG